MRADEEKRKREEAEEQLKDVKTQLEEEKKRANEEKKKREEAERRLEGINKRVEEEEKKKKKRADDDDAASPDETADEDEEAKDSSSSPYIYIPAFTPSYYRGAPKTQIHLPKGKYTDIQKLPVLLGTNPNLTSPTTGPAFIHKHFYGATPISIGPDLSKVSFFLFLFSHSLSFL